MHCSGVASKHSCFVLQDGARIAYSVHGYEHLNHKNKALPLVLIAGAGSTQVDWIRLVPLLSRNRPILTFDHRGLGLSTLSTPEGNDNLTMESMTRDIIALIESLGWTDVDILAFSMGGILLQQLLLFHKHPTNPIVVPFRVHHALLTATLASPIASHSYINKLPVTDETGQPLKEDQKRRFLQELIADSFGPKWMAAPENQATYRTWSENLMVNRPFEIIMRQRRILNKFSFIDQLKHISPATKVLVIHGTDDSAVPFRYAEAIVKACPHAQLVSVGPKRGQVPSYAFGHIWYEFFEADVWIGVIESFLDDSAKSKL